MTLSPEQRLASIAAGMAFIGIGGRGSHRLLSRTLGIGLIACGAAGCDPISALMGSPQPLARTRAALSGPKGIHVRAALTVAHPRPALYRLWRDLAGLPAVLPHVARINRLDDRRSQWTVTSDHGVETQWEAELVNTIDNETVAWRSRRSRVVTHAGSVRFRDVPAGTEVLVHLQYRPVAGALGALAARLLGHDPARHIREDLRRMKQQLETGEIASTAGQPVGRGRNAGQAVRS